MTRDAADAARAEDAPGGHGEEEEERGAPSPPPDPSSSSAAAGGLRRPQILTHAAHRPSGATTFDVKWLPSSAKVVLLGQNARGTGSLQVLELDGPALAVAKETEYSAGFKCGTFGASAPHTRHLATGDFSGKLAVWDLERLGAPVFTVKAHSDIVNCVDGCGGIGATHGPPEIVTGGRDGAIKVWDVRQRDQPVADISPVQGQQPRDAWCVAFGNSYDDEERCVAAGYDNGDVKMFDLRSMKLVWETNLRNGVCGVQFDRKDIQMNKLVCTTLEASFTVHDLRTHHPKNGFASLTQKAHDGTTVWTVRHLPQNRDVFVTGGGNGSLNLYKYNYPAQRSRKDADGKMEGVPGTVTLLNNAHVAEQPVGAFDWSPDKLGLCVFASFDQTVRVGVVTKLAAL